MAAHSPGPDGTISQINVTPFVDVVLVLLIILMVTSTEIARRAIAVDLPSAASAGQSVPRTLNLVLEADGATKVDGEPVSDEALAPLIRRAKAEDPDVRAVISADQAVPYRSVVHLIDVVKQAGVSQFALDVVPELGS